MKLKIIGIGIGKLGFGLALLFERKRNSLAKSGIFIKD
jgi:hypothetical protein